MRKKKQLDIATKGLREMIIKQNTRDFRREQQDKAARRSKEYGKVLFEVSWSFSWHHKTVFLLQQFDDLIRVLRD